ncbi:MAG: type II toxin-antitoxin system VapC family toxin [Gammaproteobacteria bacterium]|nr:type II toxin-antitoxin system VapC family toxin [Gammaproteobacteria bacterium]
MSFLLDTNICIYLLNDRRPEAIEIARRFVAADCMLSVMTELELEVGRIKSQRGPRYEATLAHFLGSLTVLPLTREDARRAAGLRAVLETKGTPIGPYDLLIAAQALSRDLTVVTNNETEFRRVPGLKLENWIPKTP